MPEPNQLPLFEVVDQAEFAKAKAARQSGKRTKKFNTDDRTYVTWFRLPHHMGFCTVPAHDETIRALDDTQQVYRQKYPSRMVFDMGEYTICRDCFISEADRE